jgi:ankyrin repeat protein
MRAVFLVPLVLLSSCASARPRLDESEQKELAKEAYQAVRRGDLKAFREYIAQGLPINYGRGESETPLHWAADLNKLEIAQWILDHGADVNARRDIGFTPLQYAASRGRVEIVKLLLKKNADPNIAGGISSFSGEHKNETPLYWAARGGFLEIVQLLISHGADINKKDSLGVTPFYLALRERHENVGAYLLTLKDVDINTRDPYAERTPLHEALGHGYDEIAKELIRRGSEVNGREGYGGYTPLHFAARRKDRSLVEMLLAKGADPTVKNKKGLTPADEAEKAGNKEIAELLRLKATVPGK